MTEFVGSMWAVGRVRVVEYFELTKPRLNVMVLVTVLIGFVMATPGPLNLPLLLSTLIGVALLSGGGCALNEFIERDLDALMGRTCQRTLPAGRLAPGEAFVFGLVCCVTGTLVLMFRVNGLTAWLGAGSALVYVLIYTPLKLRTPLNTVVGAVSGAMPPLMGWTAAAGSLDLGGWLLFLILFAWQLPHFFAIAWFYRDEYAAAGMRMLSVVDHNGPWTCRIIVWSTVAMLGVSLLPVAAGLGAMVYLTAALVLGSVLMVLAVRLTLLKTRLAARHLFLASLIYLPLLLGFLVLDRILP